MYACLSWMTLTYNLMSENPADYICHLRWHQLLFWHIILLFNSKQLTTKLSYVCDICQKGCFQAWMSPLIQWCDFCLEDLSDLFTQSLSPSHGMLQWSCYFYFIPPYISLLPLPSVCQIFSSQVYRVHAHPCLWLIFPFAERDLSIVCAVSLKPKAKTCSRVKATGRLGV